MFLAQGGDAATQSGYRAAKSSINCDISPFTTTPREHAFEELLIDDYDDLVMADDDDQCQDGLRLKPVEVVATSCTALSEDDSAMADVVQAASRCQIEPVEFDRFIP